MNTALFEPLLEGLLLPDLLDEAVESVLDLVLSAPGYLLRNEGPLVP
jgi:hypothetical protein